MCYGLTKDKEDINNAVQELFIYFLERPELVKKQVQEVLFIISIKNTTLILTLLQVM